MLRARACRGLSASPPLLDGAVEIADELGQLALGGGEAALVDMDGGQRQARLDMGRRAADRVAEAPGGLVEPAQPARHQAEIVGQHRLVGVLGHRLAPQGLGFVERAALRQADREEVQDVGPFAVAGERRAEMRLGTVEPAGPQILQAGLQIGIGRRGAFGGAGAMARCVDPTCRQGQSNSRSREPPATASNRPGASGNRGRKRAFTFGGFQPAGMCITRNAMAKDVDLFAAAMADVKPLRGRRPAPRPPSLLPRPNGEGALRPPDRTPAARGATTMPDLSPDDGVFDRDVSRALSRGRLAPEATLDLHGMTLAAAERAVARFLERATAQDLRLVLIVTGKGLRVEGGRVFGGRIRAEFVGWLNRADNRGRVTGRAAGPSAPRRQRRLLCAAAPSRFPRASSRSLRATPQR